jgi:hypothetical protein
LLDEELTDSGVAFEMPVNKVIVGKTIDEIVTSKQDKQDQVKQAQAIATKVPHLSLNFDRGTNFESILKKKFGHSVNFVPGFQRREFLLVVSFGRASFNLNIHTVGLALQSCFGGLASKFHVKFLPERVFRFSVASRSVGFEMYNARKFSKNEFEFFIHLWGNGGPNWKFEEKKFYKEQEKEWTVVQKKGSNLQKLSSPKKIIRTSVFERLVFPLTVSASNNSSNGATAKSYAQVVKGTKFPSSNNGLIY